MWKWIIAVVIVVVTGLISLVAVRTAGFPVTRPAAATALPEPGVRVDAAAAAARLAAAIRFRTLSVQAGEPWDRAPFAAQRQWLESAYPAFHAAAQRETVEDESLLYTWAGSDPALSPILLMAHLDVVPVEDPSVWAVEPFAGVIEDGYVWGRGALDDKGSAIALLEAADALVQSGFKPRRSILFAFGHNEEVSGSGAAAIARTLRERGVAPWFALDEGMVIIAEHPMTNGPVALIGVGEKGYGTLRLTAVAEPGHSSTPSPETAVSNLAQAVTRVHDMPITLALSGGPAMGMMRALGDEIPLPLRAAAANEWLFGSMIESRLGADPLAAALTRTTIAPTILRAGEKENVLPGSATALINVRLHPRDKADSILQRARAAVADVGGVSVEWTSTPTEASVIADTRSDSYALLAAVAGEAADGAKVAPTLVLGATDSRHFVGVAENVYRFTPVVLTTADIASIHGIDERVSIENLDRMITAYAQLMRAGAQ